MLAKSTLHQLQLSSVPYGAPNPYGEAIPWGTRSDAVVILCRRSYTGSTRRTRRPLLQLLHHQSRIPSQAPVLAMSSASMGEQKELGRKWGATVTGVIPATIDKVWTVLADFDGIQRNFPKFFGTCETVEGEKNKPGSLRVATGAIPTPAGKIIEVRERLLALDDVNHTTSYVAEHNDFGWTGFQAHISCESVENGQTLVKWTYEVNPTNTITEEGYISKQSGLYLELLEITKGIVCK